MKASVENNGMTTKRKIIIASIVVLLLVAIAILIAVLFTTTIINQELVDVSSSARSTSTSTCGDTKCVHGSCRCVGGESTCVCFGNYTGESCDTLKPASCSGDRLCLRFRGPPKPDRGWYTVDGSEYEYLLIRSHETWRRARRICRTFGGDLASMGIRYDSLKIATSVQLFAGNVVWIGLEKQDSTKWRWINGDLAFNAHWLPDQPRFDYRSRDNCAALDGSNDGFGSINLNCNSKYFALCEKRVYN